MDTATDILQTLALVIGAVGGVIAAVRAIVEMRRNREQAAQELRWKQTREAKKILDEMKADSGSTYAMRMLDWSGRSYPISESERVAIKQEDVHEALQNDDLRFTKKQVFIRDCFDSFLDYLEELEYDIGTRLIMFPDVEAQLEYYVRIMARHKTVYAAHMAQWDFTHALAFCERFAVWREAPGTEGAH